MKKLLSLLSILTISGNAAPTTIAASPYQKAENSGFITHNNFSFIAKNMSKFWGNTYKSDYKDVKLFNFSSYDKDFDDFIL